jgi:hypothetical protein
MQARDPEAGPQQEGAMPFGGDLGKFPPTALDKSGPRWMVVLGILLFAIGVACAL